MRAHRCLVVTRIGHNYLRPPEGSRPPGIRAYVYRIGPGYTCRTALPADGRLKGRGSR